MKLICLFLLVVVTFGNAQNFENTTITYVVSQQTFDLSKLKEEAKKSASAQERLRLFEEAENVKATLRVTNKESIYEVEKPLINDADKKINMTYFGAGSKNIYYSDKTELFTSSNSTGENLRIIQEKVEWELLKDTKKIGKYTCYKAIQSNSTSKVKPIAWYTLEIPLPFGPKNYAGLPGLILELEERKYIFKTTLISLNSPDFEPIEKPTKGKKITYAEWQAKAKGFFDN